MSNGTVKVTYVKSGSKYSPDQRQTLRSLGFRRLHQTIERPDTPSVRGMIAKVRHLVVVEGEGQLDESKIHEPTEA